MTRLDPHDGGRGWAPPIPWLHDGPVGMGRRGPSRRTVTKSKKARVSSSKVIVQHAKPGVVTPPAFRLLTRDRPPSGTPRTTPQWHTPAPAGDWMDITFTNFPTGHVSTSGTHPTGRYRAIAEGVAELAVANILPCRASNGVASPEYTTMT